MKVDFNSTTNILTVDGVAMNLEFLKYLARPNPDIYYQVRKEGNSVTLRTFTDFRQLTEMIQ